MEQEQEKEQEKTPATESLPPSPLWSVSKLAKYLAVDNQTVYRWIKSGKIKSVKFGCSIRIEEAEIKKLFKELNL